MRIGEPFIPPSPNEIMEAVTLSEDAAKCALECIAAKMAIAVQPLWHLGDGYGGQVRMMLGRELAKHGLPVSRDWTD